MDSTQTPTENTEVKSDKKETNNESVNSENDIKVTPEQVLSASVAKKRRTITRKRTSELNKARSQTPMRAGGHDGTSSEDETNESRPKTPERKRRIVSRTSSNRTIESEPTNDETKLEEKKELEPSPEISESKVEKENEKDTNDIVVRREKPKLEENISDKGVNKEFTRPKSQTDSESGENVEKRIRAKTKTRLDDQNSKEVDEKSSKPKSHTDIGNQNSGEMKEKRVRSKTKTNLCDENGVEVKEKLRPKSQTDSEKSIEEPQNNEVNQENLQLSKNLDNFGKENLDATLENNEEKGREDINQENPKPIERRYRPKKIDPNSKRGVSEPRLQTTERKLKSKKQTDSAQTSDRTSLVSETSGYERSSSIPRQLEEQIYKLDNFVTTNKKELINLFQKAKNTVEEKGRELRKRKFHKTDQKRSQSTPKQLTEEDLLESFRRAQVITAKREKAKKRSESARRYSSESEDDKKPEPLRPSRKQNKQPTVQEIIKEKKQKLLKNKVKSNKIIEMLDPKTSKVIAVKEIGKVAHMGYLDAFKIFKYYGIREIRTQYKKYKTEMKEEYSLIKKQRRKCISHLLLLIIFCGLGGMVFKFTEGHFENFYKCGVKRVKRDFIDILWTKSHNLREEEWKSLARSRLRIFEEELHTAHEAGIHSYSGQKSWSFINGLFYCITVVSTIGYGHIYPTTTTGRALTIVYSLIGIPLFLIILTDFGKLFTRCIKFLWSFVRRLYYTGSCRSVRKTAHVQEIFKGAQMMYDIATFRKPSSAGQPNVSPQESNEGNTTAPPTPAISNYEIDDEFNLPISVAILLLVLYIFTGAILFQIWEGWDFFASFYFVFISMSTIGFGDYVPSHPIFKIISIVYLVFGLALMSMCINVVQVKLSDTFSQASAKIGATIGLGVAEDGSIKTVPPKNVEMPPIHGSMVDIQVEKSSPTTSTNSNV